MNQGLKKKFNHVSSAALVLAGVLFPVLHTVAITVNKVPTGISQETSIYGTILTITQWIIDIAGSVAVLALIYGGFRYVVSAGNEKDIETAKEIIKYAIIGIVVIIIAQVIVIGVNDLLL